MTSFQEIPLRATTSARLHGLWLPLITPFRDGALDEGSLRRLLRHYLQQPLDGLILAGTTGEAMTLDGAETERLMRIGAEEVAGRLPLFLGLSGSDTRVQGRHLAALQSWPLDGYLIACPYYTRPSQEGLYHHFAALAAETDRPILIYNIPYRTGVNLANETLLRLAELGNISGVKDCCADAAQSSDLIRQKPEDFAVLTGEDAWYYSALVQGADGAILASAHIETARFAAIRRAVEAGDHRSARRLWDDLIGLVRLLFAEPNPAAIKHCLWRSGLIASPELRLPMMPASAGLAARLDQLVSETGWRASA
ncbi:MAG TPA: 4-hydroxy-tetrahydrodipicolinate synthase [Dongiaceae bacterium]|nr:4-hydroxy-tetrahydrodipicolinate synthase [Dongiaceae bacterium]